MCMQILLVYFWRQKFLSCDSRGGEYLYICKSVGLLKLIFFVPWLNFFLFGVNYGSFQSNSSEHNA